MKTPQEVHKMEVERKTKREEAHWKDVLPVLDGELTEILDAAFDAERLHSTGGEIDLSQFLVQHKNVRPDDVLKYFARADWRATYVPEPSDESHKYVHYFCIEPHRLPTSDDV